MNETESGFERGIAEAGLSARLGPEQRQLLYAELKAAARRQRRKLGAPGTLQTTAVVHEAWLRLRNHAEFVDEAHFMASAALAMRYVIIDYIRAARAGKRAGQAGPNIEDFMLVEDARHAEVLAVHEALGDLAALKPRCVHVVECRYFGGYTDAETAEALAVDERTVRRDWLFARAWLRDRLDEMPRE
ncbi:MAG: sigma-70 family RNA polymerase sigma factor [Dokdonella sp.]|nr:sigma-70 family RNA polymerase sigma factor [Dokdonella sp.]MCB1572408.1 sigma-70 family RNA polymerase sigma factor [Xanthomonadales bacterium]